MSTELKLLRSIVSMETKATESLAPDLAELKASVGLASAEFQGLLTKLYRKGYVTTDWQPTPAGRQVASRALGQVPIRQQPRGRQSERGSNTKTRPRKIFRGSQPQMPPPLLNTASNAHSKRNGPPPLKAKALPRQMLEGQERTPPPLPSSPGKDASESFVAVRDSELEELKPRR